MYFIHPRGDVLLLAKSESCGESKARYGSMAGDSSSSGSRGSGRLISGGKLFSNFRRARFRSAFCLLSVSLCRLANVFWFFAINVS